MDMMLDVMKPDEKSASSDNHEEDDNDQFHRDAKLTHPSHAAKKKSLDELVVVASAFNLLAAGYDTTSMALSYLGHQLALNPGKL